MIKTLNLIQTECTPEVIFDKKSQIFVISGDILPENSFDLFDPITDWIKEYSENPDKEFTLEFSINIINTSSTRRLVHLFRLLEILVEKGTKVKVIWRHLPDDEIMQYTAYEFGNVFSNIIFETQVK